MKTANKHNQIIIHVYYSTAGNSGLYMSETIKALSKLECDLAMFVNYYYALDDQECHKIFFKRTETMKRNRYRKYFKYIEMIHDFHTVKKRIHEYARKYKEVFIVYSLNECYKPAYCFLEQVRKIKNVKLGILVHDVVPFRGAYSKSIYVSQEKILSLASFFVSHNRYTTDILKSNYDKKEILQYRFPLMDLTQMPNTKHYEKSNGTTITFLFLGYLRVEKGINVLLNAWEKIEGKYDQAQLIIAGKIPEGIAYDFSKCSRIELLEGYLDDNEYSEIIQKADYGVLPYIEGTNSGVLSTISCYGKPSITSDLPMFQESYFALPELSFEAGNSNDLFRLISDLIEGHNEKYSTYLNIMADKIAGYKSLFEQETAKEYGEKLLCNS